MIDDAFLRQTAALQANLKMLESQQDALSDFQDMQALRLYKARVVDYIEAHSKAGHLPPDPFQVIQQRLIAVSDFFTAADNEYKRFTSWKKSWIKGIPNISLSDIQSASSELSDLVAELPHAQQRLRQMLSALDWDTSSNTVDLHPELLACAQCVAGLKFPNKEVSRNDLYQFAQGEGKLAKGVSTHLAAMGLRIEELTQQHAIHAQAIVDAEVHASNHDFRSAEKIFLSFGKDRFSDLNYTIAEARIVELVGIFDKVKSFDPTLDEYIENYQFKIANAELDQLRALIRPDSELGREALALLQKMESRLAVAQKAHKNKMVARIAIYILIIVSSVALVLYVNKENAKAEEARVIALAKAEIEAVEAQLKADREATEAKAKADREAAEAKAKAAQAKAEAKAAWANSFGKRAGEERVIVIAPGVEMTFCWCPAGKFTMGSPESEAGRSDDENQVEVTLSQGFWMAKTEVAQAQWQAVMGENPSSFKGTNRPVEEVSWSDAQEFLTKLNAVVGNSGGGKMVLPTEAQWEYAARAGETGPYSGGMLDEVAWYDVNSGRNTPPVGTKKPNAWGLHDMHGNVWEWCADSYTSKLEGGVDPQGAASGANRVVRGGSWVNVASYCRVAVRNNNYPSFTNGNIGFRVARSSVP
jgi:formylglycine-generating enzyme required for sulfatase activity